MHSQQLQNHKSRVELNWWFPSARRRSRAWAALPQGQKKPEEEAELWGWSQRKAGRKSFSFLEVSDLNGSWRTRFAALAPTRGRAREMERTTDISKRNFTSSQPHLQPCILQGFSQSQQKPACLCRTSTKAKQSAGHGHFAILFFPYF